MLYILEYRGQCGVSDFHDSYSKVSMRQKRSHERLDIVSVTVILAKR